MTSSSSRTLLTTRSNKNLSRTCEAYECRRKATTQLKVNVGVFGDVDLHLCKNCVPKFSNKIGALAGLENQLMPVNGKEGLPQCLYT